MAYKIGVIVGSTRPQRLGLPIGQWFVHEANAASNELTFDLIDLKEINLPFLDEPKSADTGEYMHEHTKKWSELISGYDGFVLVTAEYNHGPPAPLKNALDFLAKEWSRKPVAFVGYGGLGGARAVTLLRVITSELGMAPVWSALHIRAPWTSVHEDGSIDPDFISGKMEKFLDELTWWTKSLHNARHASD